MRKETLKVLRKRILSLAVVFSFVLTMLPIGALADWWKSNPEASTGYIYYYNNNKVGAGSITINGPEGMQYAWRDGQDIAVYKYQLQNKTNASDTVYTYCSDLSIIPRYNAGGEIGDLLYQRIPIENIAGTSFPNQYFFNHGGGIQHNAGKLRAILVNSDLYSGNSLSNMKTAASKAGYSVSHIGSMADIQVGTQAAIWSVVNQAKLPGGEKPYPGHISQGAYEYYSFLINLAPMEAGELTSLAVTDQQKSLISGQQIYTATITFGVKDSNGLTSEAVKFTDPSAIVVTDANGEPVPGVTVEVKGDNTVTVKNIPQTVNIKVTVPYTTTVERDNVYLYAPKTQTSQTLVSVEKGTVDLSTTVLLTAPASATSLTVNKEWKSLTGRGEIPLSSVMAKDYSANFEITMYSKKLDGTAVAADIANRPVCSFTVNGYTPWQSGNIFEYNAATQPVYKIAEVSTTVDGETTPVSGKHALFYVDKKTVSGQPQYVITWLKDNGSGALVKTGETGSGKFVNLIVEETGFVSVQKAVVNNGKDNEVFNFTATYAPKGSSTFSAYANEEYVVYKVATGEKVAGAPKTDANGAFTLKPGFRAEFAGMPVGATLKVAEDKTTIENRYTTTVTDSAGTREAYHGQEAVTTTEKVITFTNTYLVADLTLSKNFVSPGNTVTWNNFSSGIKFIVTDADGKIHHVNLDKSVPTKTIQIPYGSYTIKEERSTATLAGYTLDITSTLSKADAGEDTFKSSMTVSGEAVSFTNTYGVGSLTIKKEVPKTYFESLTKAQQDEINSKTFTFKVYKDSVADGNLKATIKLSPAEWAAGKAVPNLLPGDYLVVEEGAQVADVRLTTTATGGNITGTTADGATVKINVSTSDTTVTFVNTYQKQSGSLIITKAFAGDLKADKVTKTIGFEVENTATHEVKTVTMSKSDLQNGKWVKKVDGLTPGTYTVTEITDVGVENTAQIPNYSLKVTGNGCTVSVSDSGTAEAREISNEYSRQLGSITFSKAVIGYADGETFTFMVICSEAIPNGFAAKINGSTVSGLTLSKTTIANDTLVINGVKKGDTVVVSGLPVGAKIEVTEVLTADQQGYFKLPAFVVQSGNESQVTVASRTVDQNKLAHRVTPSYVVNTLPAGSNPLVLGTVTNTREENINLVLTKDLALQSELNGAVDWANTFPNLEIKFTIRGPLNWGEQVTGADKSRLTKVSDTDYSLILTGSSPSINLNGIPAGKYTVIEDTASAAVANYTLSTWYKINSTSLASYVKTDSLGNVTKVVAPTGTDTTVRFDFRNVYTMQTQGIGAKKDFTGKTVLPDEVFVFDMKFFADDQGATPYAAKSDLKEADWGAFPKQTLGGTAYPSWNEAGTIFTFALLGNQTGTTYTMTGIPHGTYVQVVEKDHPYFTETNPGIYKVGSSSSTDGKYTLAVSNARIESGVLSVTKATDEKDDGEAFNFIIKIKGIPWAGSYVVTGGANPGAGTTKSTKTDGKFTLLKGETAKFIGLPLGYSYTVSETGATEYSTSITTVVKEIPSTAKGTKQASGTITADAIQLTFMNARNLGSLTINKTVVNNLLGGATTPGTYTFQVMRQPLDQSAYEVVNGPAKNITGLNENGQFILTVDGNGKGSVTLGNLPYGKYQITELNVANTETMEWTVDGGATKSFKIDAATQTLAYENIFDTVGGPLEVKKAVVADGSFTVPVRDYTLYLKDASGNAISGANYKRSLAANPEALIQTGADGSFTITAGETVTFPKLTKGFYQVTEKTDVSTDTDVTGGFTFISKAITLGDGSSIPENGIEVDFGKTPVVKVTNTYQRDKVTLSIQKTSDSDTTTVPELDGKEFTFVLWNADQNAAVKNAPYTVQGKTGGFTTNSGEFKLAVGDTAVFAGFPTGSYLVRETNVGIDGYGLTVTLDGVAWVKDTWSGAYVLSKEAGDKTITVKNNYVPQYGELTITKTVEENPLVEDDWAYTFDLSSGKAGWGDKFIVSGDSSFVLKTADATNKVYTYTLTLSDAEPTRIFEDIPVGTYTVTEVGGTGTDNAKYEWTVVPTVAAQAPDESVSGKTATVIIGNTEKRAVAYSNDFTRKLGTLNLLKDVEFKSDLADVEFTFELVGPEGDESADRGPVTIKGAESWIAAISDLPTGTYKIREKTDSLNNISGFTFEGNDFTTGTGDAKETLKKDSEGWVEFTLEDTQGISFNLTCENDYSKDGAELKVTKAVDGYAGNDLFTFRIKAADGAPALIAPLTYYKLDAEKAPICKDGSQEWEEYPAVEEKDSSGAETGWIIFTIEAGETAIFRGLNLNSGYLVQEIVGNNYTLTAGSVAAYDYQRGFQDYSEPSVIDSAVLDGTTLTATSGDKVQGQTNSTDRFPGLLYSFENARKLGQLSVTKQVVGLPLNAEPFTFQVTFAGGGIEDFGTSQTTPEIWFGDETAAREAGNGWALEGGILLIYLHAGETATIKNLPLGVEYAVAEKGDTDSSLVKIEKNGIRGEVNAYHSTFDAAKSGRIGETTATVCTNTREIGEMYVKKILYSGESANSEAKFPIRVSFYSNGTAWESVEALQALGYFTEDTGGTWSIDGNALIVDLNLGSGEEAHIQNIPVGTTYTVEEPFERLTAAFGEDAKNFNVLVSYSDRVHLVQKTPANESGTKDRSGIDRVTVFNFEIPKDTLVITKSGVEAAIGSDLHNYSFEFELKLFAPDPKLPGSEVYYERLIKVVLPLVEERLAELDKEITAIQEEGSDAQNISDLAALKNAEDALAAELDEIMKNGLEDCSCDDGTVYSTEDCEVCAECEADGCVDGAITCPDCPEEGECATCGDTKEIDCSNCEAGWVTTCGDSRCTDGVLTIPGECDICDGEGQVLSEVAKTAIKEKEDAFGLLYSQDELDRLTAMRDRIASIKTDGSLTTMVSNLEEAKNILLGKSTTSVDGTPRCVVVDLEKGTYAEPKKGDPYVVFETGENPEVQAFESDRVTLVDAGWVKVADGVYTFNLRAGQYLEVSNLPAGATYTVKEIKVPDRGDEGFINALDPFNERAPINMAEGLSGSIGGDAGRVAAFLNTFREPLGKIIVQKSWVGGTPSGLEFIEVQLYSVTGSGEPVAGEIIKLYATDGYSGAFTGLKLDPNVKYFVKELTTIFRYSVTYSTDGTGGVAVVYDSRTPVITVTNTYNEPGGSDGGDRDPKDPEGPELPDNPTPLDPGKPPEENPELPEPPVPLDPFEPEPDLELPEPNVPLGPMPQTSGIGLGAIGLIGAGLLGTGLIIRRREEEEGQEN